MSMEDLDISHFKANVLYFALGYQELFKTYEVKQPILKIRVQHLV